MNKTLKQLEAKRNRTSREIQKFEEKEIREIQIPYLKLLVGKCFVYRDNSYGSSTPNWDMFRKILEYFEVDGCPYLIFEEVQVDGNGCPKIELNNHLCYTNRRWFKEPPFSGWVKCGSEEYQTEKERVYKEMSSPSQMKKRLKEK